VDGVRAGIQAMTAVHSPQNIGTIHDTQLKLIIPQITAIADFEHSNKEEKLRTAALNLT